MKLKNLLENKQGTFWRVEGKNGFVRRIYEIDPKYITEKDKKRFMSFVNKQPGKNGCWIWTGWRSKHPSKEKKYGMFSWKGNNEKSIDVRATRFSYVMNYGKKIPNDRTINHLCGNSSCVKPTHFYLGTEQDNIIDRNYPDKQPNLKTLMKKNYI